MRYRFLLVAVGLAMGCGGQLPVQGSPKDPSPTAEADDEAAEDAAAGQQQMQAKPSALVLEKETVKVLIRNGGQVCYPPPSPTNTEVKLGDQK